jgi:hypothetical protein
LKLNCGEVNTWYLNGNIHFYMVFNISEQTIGVDNERTIGVDNYNKNNKGQEYVQ